MIRVVVELEKSPVVFVVESDEDKKRKKLPLSQKSVVLNETPEENYYHQLAIAKSSVDQVSLRSRLQEHVDNLLEETLGRKKKTQAPVPSSSSRKKNRRNIPMDRSRPLDEAQSSSSSSQVVVPVNELRKSQSSSDPAFLRVSGSSQGDGVQLRSSSEALGEHQSEITIYMGNPIVESFKGIVHLYRAFTPPYDEEGLPTNPDASWIPRSPSSLPVCDLFFFFWLGMRDLTTYILATGQEEQYDLDLGHSITHSTVRVLPVDHPLRKSQVSADRDRQEIELTLLGHCPIQ